MKSTILVIMVVCFTSVLGIVVEISVDRGVTWTTFSDPLDNPPLSAMLRVRGESPFVTVPSCALRGSLLIQVWRDENDRPLGMRWTSKGCHPTASIRTDGVTVETIVPKIHRPDWKPYVHDIKELEEQKQQLESLEPERKGWWRRYSLYIMIFFVIALGQGIRKELAEQRMELEREEEEKKRKSRSRSGQVRVVVPKRKDSRVRKRPTGNASTKSS